jgi:hypothetical protein
MKAFTGATRMVFLIFFCSHIPITIFIDSQALFPEWLYPTFLKDLIDFYAGFVQDPLMSRPLFGGLWFQSLVACELQIQLFFFVVAIRQLLLVGGSLSHWPDWFRSTCLVYASHTCTTMVPILTVLLTNPESSATQKCMALAVYLPYLLVPAWLLVLALASDVDVKKSKTA